VISSVTTLTAQKAHDKGLEFLAHVAPAIPEHLLGDPLRLGQILTNLVNNAVKFTERGEIRLNIELLERTGEKVQLKFSVRDTGIGMTTLTMVANGQEALDVLQRAEFDMVITDVQMPVMDGYETTRRIRANPAWAHLPIIAMTAHAMVQDRVNCIDAGMNDYVTKPFDPQELFRVLLKWAPLPGHAGAMRSH
jgi:CheY-like chemotaxis protein